MSRRLPPPPRGLPPRPSRTNHGTGAGESYRPPVREFRGQDSSYNREYDRPSAARDRGPPSGPSSYRPSYDSPGTTTYDRSYGAPGTTSYDERSYRPSYDVRDDPAYESRSRRSPPLAPRSGSSYRPADIERNDSFTFNYDAPPGLDYTQSTRAHSPPRRRINQRNDRSNGRPGYGQGAGRGGYRGRGGPRIASDRAFLKTNRLPTPELMAGMDYDGKNIRYVPIEDLSDSDEAEMEISDNEGGTDQPKKRLRITNESVDGENAPKWSNPDPYTVLPPLDHSGPKKDIVKLIRKARITTDGSKTSTADSDDFISFDFNDMSSQADNHDHSDVAVGIKGAPTGPRMSLQQQQSHHGEPSIASQIPEDPIKALSPFPRHDSRPIAQPRSLAARMTQPQKVEQSGKALRSNGQGKKSAVLDVTSDPALGSRKRNSRDEIKPPPDIHDHSTGKKQAASGKIVSFWQPVRGSDRCPWIDLDHSDSASMGTWLHKEIMDFYHFVKPREFEDFIRAKLIEDLQQRVQRKYNGSADIHAFGSYPAGLYLPTADIDLVLVSNDYMERGRIVFQGNNNLRRFAEFLRQEKLALRNDIEMIFKAKVPLVKYVDRLTGLKVDISFENTTGLVANTTFQQWKVEFPALPILVTIIKHLLAMRGLNEPVNGGIGGFSVTCLVVSLFQNMPQVQSRSMIPEHHLGEILMEFLDLYGNQFNTTLTAISLKPPGYLSKAHMDRTATYKGPQNKFTIIDPNNPDNDISGGSSNTVRICEAFSKSYNQLQDRMAQLQHSGNRKCASILDCIIGGNYSSFKLQRDHLQHVHEQIFGPVST